MQFKCLWKGTAQSQLKFLLRGLGCSSHTCRRLWLTCRRVGVLGVEERVGVSFIKAEAATETRVVSMDSSSKSSMSNESTRETSFVISATILKETSLMGVCALASFVGVHALGSFEGVGALGLL